jgi:hypothetical protein
VTGSARCDAVLPEAGGGIVKPKSIIVKDCQKAAAISPKCCFTAADGAVKVAPEFSRSLFCRCAPVEEQQQQ